MTRTAQTLAGLALSAVLWGCGPDSLTAATANATAAAAAAKQGQQEKAMADQKIKAMEEALQKHDQDLREQADHGSQ
jgi:hypothetical protein